MDNDKTILFFKSALCPRCLYVGRVLAQIQKERPDLQIEHIDILLHPGKALHHNIRMIPALVRGEDRLAGVFLGKNAIETFLAP